MKLSIKLGIGFGITLIVILLFGWWIFPALIRSMIKKNIVLKPGSTLKQMWTKVPFPVDFKVYIFNVTNARDVHTIGDSPVVDEIGPYIFDEWKEKVNLVDNPDGTITYNPKTRFVFNQKKSGKLTMNEVITIPHPMMTGMLLAVAREKPAMLGLLGKAVKEIFNDPQSIFVTASVWDILFGGLVVNCSVSSFGAKAVCTNIKTQAENFIKLGENDYLFSFFGVKNKSIDETLTVMTGLKNPYDVGRVTKWGNKTEMNVWTTKACNQFEGTDSTIFPAFLTEEEGVVSFAPDLCRSLGAFFVEDTEYLGIPVRKYSATYGDMYNNEDEKCYCPTKDTCLKKGAMDLQKCTGVPMIVSLPHFYDSDPSYLEGIRGLHPEEDKHGIVILFEHMSGTPVSAYKRLQFSLPIEKLSKVSLMTNLPKTMLPLMWVEEGASLGPEIIQQLDKQLFRTFRIIKGVKWTIFTISLVGLVGALILHFYKCEKFQSAVAPVLRIPEAFTNGTKTDVPSRGSIISTISFKKNSENKE